MCEIKKCGCNTPNKPIICVTYEPNESCEDRVLTTSNTEHPTGYEDVSTITPEVNQISAYKEHLEFVNSPEPLSGIKKHTVLRIAQSFIDGITAGISNFLGRNVGLTGAAEIYKGPTTIGSTTYQDFRKIAGSPSIDVEQIGDNIVPSVDEEWLQEQFPDIPTINYPVIDGENLPYSQDNSGYFIFKELKDKKLQFLPLISPNLAIEYLLDVNQIPIGIQIKTPESGSSSTSSYFVDETYQPTPTSQPDGSRSRPYTTLTDAVNARIGTGTRLNPNGPKGGIVLLSDVTDSINPTINGTTFRIEGGKKYTYTGTNTYIFDYGALFDEAKISSGPLSQHIISYISGEGTITRSSGYGHVQVKNDNTYPGASAADPQSLIYIAGEGSGLNFVENEGNGYTPLTTKEGNPLFNGANVVKGANISPSVPMINVVGKGTYYFGLDIAGSLVKIITYSQIALRASQGGGIYEHLDSKIVIDQSSTFIGYQTRDISGTTVYYTPYSSKNLIESLDGSNVRIDNLSFEPDSPIYHKSNSIFRLTNSSSVSVVQKLFPISNKGAVNFIEYSGNGNIVILNNAQLESTYTNFIKGDNINSIYVEFRNSSANSITNVYNQASTTSITTLGTIGSLKFRYILTSLPLYENNSQASPIEGKNVLYRTGDGTLKITY